MILEIAESGVTPTPVTLELLLLLLLGKVRAGNDGEDQSLRVRGVLALWRLSHNNINDPSGVRCQQVRANHFVNWSFWQVC